MKITILVATRIIIKVLITEKMTVSITEVVITTIITVWHTKWPIKVTARKKSIDLKKDWWGKFSWSSWNIFFIECYKYYKEKIKSKDGK